MFKKEMGILVLLGVLEKSNDSEWWAPYFAHTKPKTDKVHFLSDFRNLNKAIKTLTIFNYQYQWNVI